MSSEPPALAAWHRRGDTTTHDALWRAACWCASAAERTHPNDRDRELAQAAAIVAGDPVASAAVAALPKARPALTVSQGGARLTRRDVRPLRRVR